MTMLNRATEVPDGRGGGGPESRLGPALARAFGAGTVVLALAVLVYVLAVSVAAWLAGTPQQALPRLASAPLYREFAGLFLASFIGIFVAREFGVRTR
jgi:ABC-type Na+ efflux pump permease subunit